MDLLTTIADSCELWESLNRLGCDVEKSHTYTRCATSDQHDALPPDQAPCRASKVQGGACHIYTDIMMYLLLQGDLADPTVGGCNRSSSAVCMLVQEDSVVC